MKVVTRTRVVAVLIVAVLVFGAYGWTAHALISIHVSFADDQTAIFDAMAAKASQSLSRPTPDIGDAAACLRYVRDYYSSGTKQVTGSKLDQVVERHRKATQDRIVELLREASGEGLGNDASAWIDRFAHSQHGSSFAEAK